MGFGLLVTWVTTKETALFLFFSIALGLGLYGIQQVTAKMEQTLQHCRDFASDAAHELRTPLTVLTGQTSLLARYGTEDRQLRDESIHVIQEEVQYMDDLISRLLCLSRLMSGTLEKQFQSIQADELLQRVYEKCYFSSVTHQFVLTDMTPTTFIADPGSVQQLLRIFIDNAIKYTAPNGIISLGCHDEDKTLVYTITDTGTGISDEDQKHLFQRSFRTSAAQASSIQGSGLGLSIAKSIADANNAAIEVTSAPHVGTTISLSFPLS